MSKKTIDTQTSKQVNELITRPTELNNKSEGYIVFNDQNKNEIITQNNKSLGNFRAIQSSGDKAVAHRGDDIGHRAAFMAGDFYRQRPFEMLPTRFRDVVFACRMAYTSKGIIRNIIDMMTDFAVEGLKLIHPDKKVEAFLRVWAKKVKLSDAVSEFVRHMLVDGNVVVMRTKAKITDPVKQQWQEKALGERMEKIYVENRGKKNEIPWQYHFLNVAALYWVGGEANITNSSRGLAFKPAETLIQAIRTPRDIFQQQLVNNLPQKIRDAVQNTGNQGNIIFLDMEDLTVIHNKKDSWEDWGIPFLYSILADIQFKDKLRMAENAALDGMINVIRLWRLGDHKEGFMPAEAALDKLEHILTGNTGGGAIDIIWDSLIDMKEFYPPIEKILGPEKYTQVNRDILIGMGVPEVLIGGDGAKFSNSWIQLKTVIERLGYLRGKVTEWLENEMRVLCEAMDIDMMPLIRFNNGNLEDQNVARKLVLGLLDRNIISVEAVHNVYGEDFLLEMERIKSEKPILKDSKVNVIGPFDPNEPSAKSGTPSAKKPGQSGRPTGDTNIGQKPREAKPKNSAPKTNTSSASNISSSELSVFAFDVIDAIDEYVIPIYMENLNVANARKLTNEQKEEINHIRLAVLASTTPNDKITEENIFIIAEKIQLANKDIINMAHASILNFASKNGTSPTLPQRKRLEASTWAEYYLKEDNLTIEENQNV